MKFFILNLYNDPLPIQSQMKTKIILGRMRSEVVVAYFNVLER
jgi:hypothetical protein